MKNVTGQMILQVFVLEQIFYYQIRTLFNGFRCSGQTYSYFKLKESYFKTS